jgi:hypothetical protein
MTYNSRGQLQDVVNISCEEGERREATFKKHLQSKGIDIFKNSKYKHYDFHLTNDRNIKIELKSVNADIDTYKYVFLGIDKIQYYLYRKIKHPGFRFFVVYGFYSIDDVKKTEQIKYMYDEIDLEKYIKCYSKKIVYNKSIYVFLLIL